MNNSGLKEKTPENAAANGKPRADKTSAFRRLAQVELARRRKKRQNAYQSAAEREQIAPESRPRFFRLLRELDRIADRIEDRIDADARQGDSVHSREALSIRNHRRRRELMEKFLSASGILTPPYDWHWVWERYDADTGRFRFGGENGSADTG